MPKLQKETPVRHRCQSRRSKDGYILFRSFVGTLYTKLGYPVKLGVKGQSDLTGFREYVVKPEDVGRKIAVYVANEVKRGDNPLSKEQENFLRAVRAAGGEAWVTRDDEDAEFTGEGKR